MKNETPEMGLLAVFITTALAAILVLFLLVIIVYEIPAPKQSNSLVIFVDECVAEGYTVPQCCWAWEDAMDFGSVQLEMPKKWA